MPFLDKSWNVSGRNHMRVSIHWIYLCLFFSCLSAICWLCLFYFLQLGLRKGSFQTCSSPLLSIQSLGSKPKSLKTAFTLSIGGFSSHSRYNRATVTRWIASSGNRRQVTVPISYISRASEQLSELCACRLFPHLWWLDRKYATIIHLFGRSTGPSVNPSVRP